MGADKNGVAGGVTNGAFREAPWHGFGNATNSKGEVVGTKVQIGDNVRTGKELLVTAGLDWKVELKTLDQLGVRLDCADEHAAVVRTDAQRILGMHSDRYGMVQNEVVGQYVDTILKSRGDAFPVSAVELWGGQVIFVVVEFRDLVKPVRKDGTAKDEMHRYMGIYTSHNGRYPLAVKYINHVWVCQNTFTPQYGETGFVIRHTRNAGDIAVEAGRSLERMLTSFDEFDREIERLLNTEASKRTLTQDVIPAVIGKRPTDSGRSQTMYDTAWDNIVAEWNDFTSQSTAFDAVMAVQGYEQHRSVVRNATRDVAAIKRILDDKFPLTKKAIEVFA